MGAEKLLAGQVLAFPTETVYGLGALLSAPVAIKEIYLLKKRPADNPLIVHIASPAQLDDLLTVKPSALERALMQAFWPGALTLILAGANEIAQRASASLPKLAVRMPAHKIARELLEAVGQPIAAPSANLSGRPSATSAEHVLQDFPVGLGAILTGSSGDFGLESTVIECSAENTIRILRPGSIVASDLAVFGPIEEIWLSGGSTSRPLSPGTKYKHYAPRGRVILFLDFAEFKAASRGDRECKSALLHHSSFPEPERSWSLQKKVSSSAEYAKELYGFLRSCDDLGVELIFCEKPQGDELGFAILERLSKAARLGD